MIVLPVVVAAGVGAAVARQVRRRRRRALPAPGEWANGRYPSRKERAERERRRRETFTEGVEFTMGRTRELPHGGVGGGL